MQFFGVRALDAHSSIDSFDHANDRKSGKMLFSVIAAKSPHDVVGTFCGQVEAKALRVVGSDVVSRVAYRSASTQASVKCQVVVCQLQQLCL